MHGSEAGERPGLARVVDPQSVAVVGASEDVGKFGGRVLHHLLKHGYGGRIVPVNPHRPSLFGLPTVPSPAAVGPVDVAVIALPAEHVVRCVEECAAAGVGAAVIITAQMGEIGGEGAARQRRIVEIARGHGMRLLGPNCLGLVNTRARLALTASFAMGLDRLPIGPVGVVSQSGALMATMFNRGYDQGLGFSALVSVGNQADLTENDVFEHLIGDPDTGAVVLYLEGVSDGPRLLALAERAHAAGKPVVAVKAGRSEAGGRATFSHTASLAGPFRLFAAAMRGRGVVLADDPDAAVLIAAALARWPAGLPRGRGIAPSSGSGGGGAIIADRLADLGLPVAEPAPATAARLAPLLPPDQPALPLDCGALATGFSAAGVAQALSIVADDPAVGALVYLMTTQPQMPEVADVVVSLAETAGKPVLLVLSAGSVADPLRAALRARQAPFCDRLDDALRVLRALAERADPPTGVDAAVPPAPALADQLAGLAPGPLTAPEALGLLAAAGVPAVAGTVARTPDEAAAAAERLGFPVVLKALGRAIVHKSDRGGVRLDLRDGAAVRAAATDMAAAFGTALDGWQLQPQARGIAELIVGSVWDGAFGAFVLVGSGGVFAEIVEDTVVAPAPLDAAGATVLLRRLKLWPVLAGARGRPPADVAAAADAVAAVSRLAAALGPRLAELDVNPLILRAQGGGALAVDARARLADPPRSAA